MINNDYKLSLNLYQYLKTLENIFLMGSIIKRTVYNKYKYSFSPLFKKLIFTEALIFVHTNQNLNYKKIHELYKQINELEDEIMKALKLEKRKNGIIALHFIKGQLTELRILLTS